VASAVSAAFGQDQEAIDLAKLGVSLQMSLLSAGLEACSEHSPSTGAKARAAYEKVRNENLDIFTRLEVTADYLSSLVTHRAQMAAAPKRELDEYCPEQLSFIEGLEQHIRKFRELRIR
jgi:hypothetical protein